MKRTTAALLLLSAPLAADAAPTDKTLVSWVTLADTAQRGGSVITIQSGDAFDGIVFGELQPGAWMAGSNFYQRTERKQDRYPVETADPSTPVQVAAVYEGTAIRLYRNGELYASHQATNIDLLSPKNRIAVFGLRHVGAGGGWFAGTIDDARIYDRALTTAEIKALRPNKKSAVAPWAWWDFNGDRIVDRTGRFPHTHAQGGANLSDGTLVLGGAAVVVAAATEAAAKVDVRRQEGKPPAGPYVTETPAMPESVPDHWLTYHLAHPGPGVGMPGDPNCAFYHKGRYHLHYIYKNNHGYAFAHVSSADMVTWNWHPTVLIGPNTGHGMFSGTGFFTKDGRPAIIYHGQGSGRNHLAFALDDHLDQWTKPVAIRPVNPDGSEPAMRHWDPDCWRDGDTYYALSGGKDPHLLRTTDLENWTHLGLLLHDAMPDIGISRDEDISCANMFRIGDEWMLLCISHRIGCRYFLGDFKDGKYLPRFHAMMNWNAWDFFAPESLQTPDGRRVMWAWCKLPGAQSAIQSLPRELSLPRDGILRINPLRELEKLRHDGMRTGPVTVEDGGTHTLDGIAGDTIELRVTIKPTDAREFGIKVFCDDAGNGFPITIVPGDKVLAMGGIRPPFALLEGEDLDLRVFLDKDMVEVFVNGRQAAVHMHPHDRKDVGISLFSKGGGIRASVQAWKMKSIYAEQSAPPDTR